MQRGVYNEQWVHLLAHSLLCPPPLPGPLAEQNPGYLVVIYPFREILCIYKHVCVWGLFFPHLMNDSILYILPAPYFLHLSMCLKDLSVSVRIELSYACFMTVAEFNKPFPSDGHWGCLHSSALIKLYCIIPELKKWHETLMTGGLEAGWGRTNCCSHVSQTSWGSGSLPCCRAEGGGNTEELHERATFLVSPLDRQVSMVWSHYGVVPQVLRGSAATF